MDRAAIGLGAAFLHLRAEINFHQIFEEQIQGFDVGQVAIRQAAILDSVDLKPSSP
jgi:hypothetical protein